MRNLSFSLNKAKTWVDIFDRSGASCGESRADYVGQSAVYDVCDPEIIDAWFKHMMQANTSLAKKTLAALNSTYGEPAPVKVIIKGSDEWYDHIRQALQHHHEKRMALSKEELAALLEKENPSLLGE